MMKRCIILTAVCGCSFLAGTARGQTILYVDRDATGPTHDGWTWCTAFTDLQDAMQTAVYDIEIRVADGTYTPDRGTGSRSVSFQLTNNVAVVGGFAGCGATDPDERDIQRYESIMSGDLDGDDDPASGNFGENSCRVVTASGTDDTAIVDGFTIANGYAHAGCATAGAGMQVSNGSASIIDCTFRDNSAGSRGGGLMLGGPATITRCTFIGNISGEGGGVYSNSQATFRECRFINNAASSICGGICSNIGHLELFNCVFIGNIAADNGGGFGTATNNTTSARLENCTFVGNEAIEGRAVGVNRSTAQVHLASCILWDGGHEIAGGTVTASYSNIYGGWPGGNLFAPPWFVDADGADDIPGNEDDDLRLSAISPCIDSGDPNIEPLPDEADLDGNPRVVDGDNDGSQVIDMGAYEYQGCELDGDCDDANACTDDTCDLVTGCVFAPVSCDAGYVCADGECIVVCGMMDADDDGDFDLVDLAVWQNCFSGPT